MHHRFVRPIEGQLRRTFDGEERLFLGSWLPPRHVYETEYCVGRMVVYIIARGPSETRTAQALSALSGRVTVQEPNLRDMPGHQRRGGENWSYRDDIYIHVPSGMAWHRPAFVEVRTNGVALPRDGYPERAVQFDFLRRDLNIRGSVWAHGTSMSAAEYHTAFVTASFGGAPETIGARAHRGVRWLPLHHRCGLSPHHRDHLRAERAGDCRGECWALPRRARCHQHRSSHRRHPRGRLQRRFPTSRLVFVSLVRRSSRRAPPSPLHHLNLGLSLST